MSELSYQDSFFPNYSKIPEDSNPQTPIIPPIEVTHTTNKYTDKKDPLQ